MNYVIHLEDEAAMESDRVGQKFSVLAKAHRNGFPVPKALAITTDAHQYFLMQGDWPGGLCEEIFQAVETLELEKGVSIRSSATREDLETQSFAGQYRTFLEVADRAELQDKIQQCWISADSKHVRSYLKSISNGNPADTPLMGIIIQQMVRASVSGVAFSCNPMRPDSNEVVIEAVEGLADKLVNGHTTPYRFIVPESGPISITPPSNYQGEAEQLDNHLPSHEKLAEIAAMARRLEQLNGATPQDVEWAIDGDQTVWLLQARAITTTPAKRVTPLDGLWTRKIANDLWADRLSPFLAEHMEKSAPVWNLSAVSRWIGLPVVEPAVMVINGYLYLNCASILAAIGALPVALRFNFLNNLLPPEAPISDLPAPSKLQTAIRLMRMLALPLWKPESIPQICSWLTRRHIVATQKKLDAIGSVPAKSAADAYRKLEAVRSELTRIQIKNQFPYFYATALTWLLRWLLTERFHLTHADFLSIVGRGGSNISLKIEKHFRAIAQKINSLPAVAEDIRRHPAAEMQNRLPPRLVADIRDVIRLYGCRSRHRSLYVKRWAEDPDEVLSIILRLVLHGVPLEPAADENRSKRHLPFWLGPLVSTTQRFLGLREDLRFLLDRCLYLLRQSLLLVGEKTELGDRVFFLSSAELSDYLLEEGQKEKIELLAGQRRDQFLNSAEASTFIVDGYPADEFPAEDRILKGIGSSPGQVTGCARVVEDPGQSNFEKGDILIAKNTDPGWTPILSIVGGMVMEEGGLLNHCSIVARELGIPSVVGVEHATRRIPDGATVHLDGGRGVIRIVDPTSAPGNQN